MEETVISLASAFLTATGLFFAALGAAATYNEPLKVFLSVAALLMTAIWLWAGLLVMNTPLSIINLQSLLAFYLPLMFLLGWFVSFNVHFYRWIKGIKGPLVGHQ